ncbi:hypothetical protein GQ607_015872 [Colletotrichum asianum]|uniref:Secreted protein n=1 Tax=Colletotrichum asianum TaxID=702518 RepID=A0A8H3ZI91_9PEZI|nr:hypothetical protein GQ607_015872 [Colletotrichum asianum]
MSLGSSLILRGFVCVHVVGLHVTGPSVGANCVLTSKTVVRSGPCSSAACGHAPLTRQPAVSLSLFSLSCRYRCRPAVMQSCATTMVSVSCSFCTSWTTGIRKDSATW